MKPMLVKIVATPATILNVASAAHASVVCQLQWIPATAHTGYWANVCYQVGGFLRIHSL